MKRKVQLLFFLLTLSIWGVNAQNSISTGYEGIVSSMTITERLPATKKDGAKIMTHAPANTVENPQLLPLQNNALADFAS